MSFLKTTQSGNPECVVRMSYFASKYCMSNSEAAEVVHITLHAVADPDKYCMSNSIVDQVTGCKVEWIEVVIPFRVRFISSDVHGTQVESGYHGLQMLDTGALDIGVIGSVPTALALSRIACQVGSTCQDMAGWTVCLLWGTASKTHRALQPMGKEWCQRTQCLLCMWTWFWKYHCWQHIIPQDANRDNQCAVRILGGGGNVGAK